MGRLIKFLEFCFEIYSLLKFVLLTVLYQTGTEYVMMGLVTALYKSVVYS